MELRPIVYLCAIGLLASCGQGGQGQLIEGRPGAGRVGGDGSGQGRGGGGWGVGLAIGHTGLSRITRRSVAGSLPYPADRFPGMPNLVSVVVFAGADIVQGNGFVC